MVRLAPALLLMLVLAGCSDTASDQPEAPARAAGADKAKSGKAGQNTKVSAEDPDYEKLINNPEVERKISRKAQNLIEAADQAYAVQQADK